MAPYERKQRLISVENLTLKYDGKPILRDLNLHVDNLSRPGLSQGQVVSLLGPSGIGKTQLFRCIAGLQQPTSGQVTLNGNDKKVTPGEVGVVFQSYPLLKHRTVWGNLMLAAKHVGKTADDVTKLLEMFGLADKKNLYPVQLSGGQKQRVAIIQQMLCSGHFLLMDEPFSGLDFLMKQKVMQLINQVATSDELNTFIITTHDIETAVAISDTIWVLNRQKDQVGNVIPGATCIGQVDLIERDLAWHEDVTHQPNFFPTVLEIRGMLS